MKFNHQNQKHNLDYWEMSKMNICDNLNIVEKECGKRRRKNNDCDCDCDCYDCDCDDCYDADDYRRRMFDDDGYESGYRDGGDPYGVSDYDDD